MTYLPASRVFLMAFRWTLMGALRGKLLWLILFISIGLQLVAPAFDALAPGCKTVFIMEFSIGAASLASLLLGLLFSLPLMTEATGGLLGVVQAAGKGYGAWIAGRICAIGLLLAFFLVVFGVLALVGGYITYVSESALLHSQMDTIKTDVGHRWLMAALAEARTALNPMMLARTLMVLWLRSLVVAALGLVAAALCTDFGAAFLLSVLVFLVAGAASYDATSLWREVLAWVLPNFALYGLLVETLSPTVWQVTCLFGATVLYLCFYGAITSLILRRRVK
jgi:hypothetical protein